MRIQTLMYLHILFLTPQEFHLYNRTVCFLGYFSPQLQKRRVIAGKLSLREPLELLSLLSGSLNCFKRPVQPNQEVLVTTDEVLGFIFVSFGNSVIL